MLESQLQDSSSATLLLATCSDLQLLVPSPNLQPPEDFHLHQRSLAEPPQGFCFCHRPPDGFRFHSRPPTWPPEGFCLRCRPPTWSSHRSYLHHRSRPSAHVFWQLVNLQSGSVNLSGLITLQTCSTLLFRPQAICIGFPAPPLSSSPFFSFQATCPWVPPLCHFQPPSLVVLMVRLVGRLVFYLFCFPFSCVSCAPVCLSLCLPLCLCVRVIVWEETGVLKPEQRITSCIPSSNQESYNDSTLPLPPRQILDSGLLPVSVAKLWFS